MNVKYLVIDVRLKNAKEQQEILDSHAEKGFALISVYNNKLYLEGLDNSWRIKKEDSENALVAEW